MRKNIHNKQLRTTILLFFVTLIGCLGTGKSVFGQAAGRIDFRLQIIGAPNYADGSAIVFNDTYSNYIDSKDALKIAAVGANLGILRHDTTLIVEGRRTVLDKDTLTFILWGLGNNTDYYLHLFPQGVSPFLTATLVDSFENTSESLDLSQSSITKTFSVTPDPLSGGGGNTVRRFAIHFARIPALPVTFISIDVNKITAGIEVNWKVAEESGILKYEIMRSSDGKDFTLVGTLAATGNSNYNWVDRNPLSGNSFFRIKAIGIDGNIKYTNIAKVFSGNIKAGINIYPNPVQGTQINLQFVNHPKGRYDVELFNSSGQVVYKGYVEHPGRNSLQFVNLHQGIKNGLYRLAITGGPEKIKNVQNLFIHSIK